MKVYLDYNGAMGITGTSDYDARWAAASANMPRWAFWLYRLSARLEKFARRFVTNIEHNKPDVIQRPAENDDDDE